MSNAKKISFKTHSLNIETHESMYAILTTGEYFEALELFCEELQEYQDNVDYAIQHNLPLINSTESNAFGIDVESIFLQYRTNVNKIKYAVALAKEDESMFDTLHMNCESRADAKLREHYGDKYLEIKNVFISDENRAGVDKNFDPKLNKEWNHFFFKLPVEKVNKSGNSSASILGDLRGHFDVFSKGLKTCNVASIDKILANQLEAELANQLEAELANQLEAELANQLKAELANQLEAELANQLEAELANQLKAELAKLKSTY